MELKDLEDNRNILLYFCRKLLIDEKEKYTVKRIGKMIKKLRRRGYALQKTEVNFELMSVFSM
jgi:hypothetical protein